MSEAGRRGFEWSSPHDHARHSAQLLLAGVATICAAYVATVVIAVTIAVRVGDLGSRHFLARWQQRLGPFGIAAAVVVLIAVLAALIAAAASASLASRATRLTHARPLTCAAADLLVVADWCTNVVWGAMGAVLVSTLIGVPSLVAAATTIAIALLVVCTKPLLAVADRAIPRLRHRAPQLADLDAVRVTNQPAALARLLLTTASDTRTVASPWQLANLWFDADTSRPAVGSLRRSFLPWMDNRDPTDVRRKQRVAASTRQALIERARLLVDQTSGDRSERNSSSPKVAPGAGPVTPEARSPASRTGVGGSARPGCCRDP